MNQAPAATAPFPIGSVQGVATRAWELCLRRDPLGLLVIPFVIFLPVYVYYVLSYELLSAGVHLDASVIGPLIGALPLVFFARVFGEAWINVRADEVAHDRHVNLGDTFSRALARSWYLAVVMVVVYLLAQIGFFLLVFPWLIVMILCSFTNQAAVLGPGRLLGSLRQSRDLVEHNPAAWFGMVAYWGIVFLGLGMLMGILRNSLAPELAQGDAGFVATLVFGLPLQVCLLVFTTCWTMFYRELEARRALHLAAHPPAAGHPPLAPTPSGPALPKAE